MRLNYSYLVPFRFCSSMRPIRFCLLFISFILFYISPKAANVTHNTESNRSYGSVSVLAHGNWKKISVTSPGIYRLTYNDLVGMQLPVAGVESKFIRLHGYAGMLPENAGVNRYDDLPEIAIKIMDGGDGRFDQNDYLLFYSPGPAGWRYNTQSQHYEFVVNIYSDKSYYFITVGQQDGKRIESAQQPEQTSTQVSFYNHRDVVSPELFNLIKSGRNWYGDFFDLVTQKEYSFQPFEPKPESEIKIRFSAVARSLSGSSFSLTAQGHNFLLPISPVSTDYTTNFGQISTFLYTLPASGTFSTLSVKYNKSSSLDNGWLNFIEIGAEALLKYDGKQFQFRRNDVTGNVEYIIKNAVSDMLLWDVSDQINPKSLTAQLVGTNLLFKTSADTVREYALAHSTNLMTPEFVESVSNQNLHGMFTPKLLVIAPTEFMSEAVRLATFHSTHDDMSVSVVTPQAIYNEFSSGAQDISAIRDFIKMLWHKAQPDQLPRYVLFFGDASYDYKNRVDSNTNIIPTYQSPESLHPIYSYATDDYFVCIGDEEGGNTNDIVDIGIGRLPVRNPEEAAAAVDKIIHYVTETTKVNGDWRNVIAFVADDEDGNVHMTQADELASMIDTSHRSYITDKIFLDAYKQESTAAGQRSPGANAAINERVAKGALVINYTGHGGETSWTHEQILEMKDINSWINYDRLPVFVTATCEFSRYDDPIRVSGGEQAFLNRKGGAIALFTTARPTFGTPNFSLVQNFYQVAFQPLNGNMPKLGDIIRLAKQRTQPSDNVKKFVLLGDPAMTLAYPEHDIITTSVNHRSIGTSTDTLSALQQVTIKGIISNKDGIKVEDFNGVITPTVFDKQSKIETLGSEGNSVMTFSLWRNIIYKGRAEVKNGEFEFSFIVPKDIAYNFGPGKISYYASDGKTDASGHYSNLIVGGFSNTAIPDTEGPLVKLFMNDTAFIDGGFTGSNPVLLAYIKDESGINTIGNSIGHDIVAILNDDTQSAYILNEYYEADINTYKSGTLRFQLMNLEPGRHILIFRIWDVHNNSSEHSVSFFVSPENQLMLSDIEAWPNPMQNEINFVIGHNQAGKELRALLNVYSLAGQRVAMIDEKIYAGGYRTALWKWNGTGLEGNRLRAGMYIANIRIETPEGYISDKSVKIIIAR